MLILLSHIASVTDLSGLSQEQAWDRDAGDSHPLPLTCTHVKKLRSAGPLLSRKLIPDDDRLEAKALFAFIRDA